VQLIVLGILGVASAIVFDILKDERIKPFVERTMRRLGLLKTRRRKHRHRLNLTEFPRCLGFVGFHIWEMRCLISSASSTGRCNTIQYIDSTMLPGRSNPVLLYPVET
jgi:hypothetical protein